MQVGGPLPKLERKTFCALITGDVHNRDIVTDMIKQKVDTINSFTWQMQLRFYWDLDLDDCVVRQVNAKIMYGCEYQGCLSRLVITPLTDRIYITATQAHPTLTLTLTLALALALTLTHRPHLHHLHAGVARHPVPCLPPLFTTRIHHPQASHLVLGCAPAGPAGTGKTETTKDLSSALGKAVYVFNCGPEVRGSGSSFGLGFGLDLRVSLTLSLTLT